VEIRSTSLYPKAMASTILKLDEKCHLTYKFAWSWRARLAQEN
jgi:hypothetical protein